MTKPTTSDGLEPVAFRRRMSGRRHGRKLRAGLQRLMDERLPGVSLTLGPAGGPLDLDRLFEPPPERAWLEIGFGAGEHLAWQAKHNPRTGIIGAEIYVNGIAGLLRRVEQESLSNVRIYDGDGRDLLEVLPEASIQRVFALFADPWPKERHHKRRLIQGATLDRLARVMRDRAELRIATDHAGYLAWILERACAHRDFHWLAERPQDWRRRLQDWPATRYEQKAAAQGRPSVYLRFRRRSR